MATDHVTESGFNSAQKFCEARWADTACSVRMLVCVPKHRSCAGLKMSDWNPPPPAGWPAMRQLPRALPSPPPPLPPSNGGKRRAWSRRHEQASRSYSRFFKPHTLSFFTPLALLLSHTLPKEGVHVGQSRPHQAQTINTEP